MPSVLSKNISLKSTEKENIIYMKDEKKNSEKTNLFENYMKNFLHRIMCGKENMKDTMDNENIETFNKIHRKYELIEENEMNDGKQIIWIAEEYEDKRDTKECYYEYFDCYNHELDELKGHYFEILTSKRCRIFFDIDVKYGKEIDIEFIIKLLKNEFKLKSNPIIMTCHRSNKESFHIIFEEIADDVCLIKDILKETQDQELKQYIKDGIVDTNVYTHKRLFRMLGNEKFYGKQDKETTPPLICQEDIKIQDTLINVFNNDIESHLKGECTREQQHDSIPREINIKVELSNEKQKMIESATVEENYQWENKEHEAIYFIFQNIELTTRNDWLEMYFFICGQIINHPLQENEYEIMIHFLSIQHGEKYDIHEVNEYIYNIINNFKYETSLGFWEFKLKKENEQEYENYVKNYQRFLINQEEEYQRNIMSMKELFDKVFEFKNKYMSEYNFNLADINFFKSLCGTGKTYFIEFMELLNNIQNDHVFISNSCVFLMSLFKELQENKEIIDNFNIVYYSDIKDEYDEILIHNNKKTIFIVNFESCHKFQAMFEEMKFNLHIDEFNGVLESIFSSFRIKQKTANFDQFEYILNHAKELNMYDAYYNKDYVKFLFSFIKDDEYKTKHMFYNNFNPKEDIKMKIHNDLGDKKKEQLENFFFNVLNDIHKNYKIALIFDRSDFAEKTYYFIKEQFENKKIILLTGKQLRQHGCKNANEYMEFKKEFAENCNYYCEDCDILIYTPVIKEGLDIEIEFHQVHVMFLNETVSTHDEFQMINRIRHAKKYNVYLKYEQGKIEKECMDVFGEFVEMEKDQYNNVKLFLEMANDFDIIVNKEKEMNEDMKTLFEEFIKNLFNNKKKPIQIEMQIDDTFKISSENIIEKLNDEKKELDEMDELFYDRYFKNQMEKIENVNQEHREEYEQTLLREFYYDELNMRLNYMIENVLMKEIIGKNKESNFEWISCSKMELCYDMIKLNNDQYYKQIYNIIVDIINNKDQENTILENDLIFTGDDKKKCNMYKKIQNIITYENEERDDIFNELFTEEQHVNTISKSDVNEYGELEYQNVDNGTDNTKFNIEFEKKIVVKNMIKENMFQDKQGRLLIRKSDIDYKTIGLNRTGYKEAIEELLKIELIDIKTRDEGKCFGINHFKI